MFAVGLWGAQMGGRSVWTLPVTFPMIMVVGGVIGMIGIPLPGIEIGIALSILALGLAIALAWRPAEWIPLLLIRLLRAVPRLRARRRTAAGGGPGRLRDRLRAGDRHDPSVRHRRRARAQQTVAGAPFARARGADRRRRNLFPCPRAPRRLSACARRRHAKNLERSGAHRYRGDCSGGDRFSCRQPRRARWPGGSCASALAPVRVLPLLGLGVALALVDIYLWAVSLLFLVAQSSPASSRRTASSRRWPRYRRRPATIS